VHERTSGVENRAVTDWNPAHYLTFADLRRRPAADLLARVPLAAPRRVADLGCGPGNTARLLAARWPDAELTGVDGSEAMLARAAAEGPPGARWLRADLATWRADAPFDLLFSNAAYQWLEGHGALFPRLLDDLAPGGALAIQMPRNSDAPSHALMREVAASGPWAARLAGALRDEPVAPPETYHRLLAPLAAAVDVWETTYLQALEGPDPVLSWTRGTALLPVAGRLDPEEYASFLAEYGARLRAAYPPEPDGRTLFPFRRLFIVALKV
jgi:trans-aconitate 2-methyltransferase